MRKSVIFATVIFFAAPAYADNCWKELGMQSMFGSYEQVEQLQSQISSSDCKVFGFIFETNRKKSYLIYDLEAAQLTRVKVDNIGKRYEQWNEVTKSRLESLDSGYGFQNLGPMKTGNGNPNLSEAASVAVAGQL